MVCYFDPPPGGLVFTEMLGSSLGVALDVDLDLERLRVLEGELDDLGGSLGFDVPWSDLTLEGRRERLEYLESELERLRRLVECSECCESLDPESDSMFHARVVDRWNGQSDETVLVCDSCVICCDYCDEYYREGDVMRVSDGSRHRMMCRVCRNVMCECYCCGYWFDLEMEGDTVDGEHYCRGCLDQSFGWCDSCDEWVDLDSYCSDCRACSSCGCSSCDRFDPLARNRRGDLLPYDYKPDPVFYGDGPLFFGFELEVETGNARLGRSSIVMNVVNDLDRVYLKHDGSLIDGFEIVTHPMSPDSLDEWFPTFSSALGGLSRVGCHSWNGHRCGFHVHISRDAFQGPRHLFAFALFIYRNAANLQRLSGRRDDELARYCRLDLHNGEAHRSSRDDGRLIDKVRRYRGGGDRMVAVNLTNSSTVEVRLFRGSLRPETIRGYLDLVLAVFRYSAGIAARDIPGGGLSWANFREWIGGPMGDYPALVDLDRIRRNVGVS